MGAPKLKWTSEEEDALQAGIAKHGAGKWRTILDDPEFSTILSSRSNIDLKDKWRTNGVKRNPESIAISSSPSLAKAEELQEGKEEEEGKSSNNSNQNHVVEENMEVQEDTNKKEKEKKKKKKDDGLSENGEVGSTCFPTMRINRIIRSEAADLRITQESIFLINKATGVSAQPSSPIGENFLERFCEDVYANVAREKRKAVEYKHVSSAVSKSKRYDFLSDYVPEKIKVEDALSERLAGI